MVGVPGVAERRVPARWRRSGVNVVLISQASSEHTICFGVRSADAARGGRGDPAGVPVRVPRAVDAASTCSGDQAILAVVGEGMKGRPGVAGKVFDSLGRQNINISAIAQGASERNISCVIDASQQVRALNAIHQGFFETQQAAGAGDDRRRQRRRRGAAAAASSSGAICCRRASTSRVVGAREQQAVRRRRRTASTWRAGRRRCARRAERMDAAAFARADRRDGADQRGAGRLHGRARRSSTPIRRSSTPTCTSSRRTSGRTRCRGAATRR